MIEKLKHVDSQWHPGFLEAPDNHSIMDKLNEVIDAVNEIASQQHIDFTDGVMTKEIQSADISKEVFYIPHPTKQERLQQLEKVLQEYDAYAKEIVRAEHGDESANPLRYGNTYRKELERLKEMM